MEVFNVLNDFLSSDLAKKNEVIAILIVGTCIVCAITAVVTWLILSKITYQIKLNDAEKKRQEYSELLQKNKELEQKNNELSELLQKYELERCVDAKNSENFEDFALDKFKRR